MPMTHWRSMLRHCMLVRRDEGYVADEARPTGPQTRQDGGGTTSAAHVAQSVDGGVGIAVRGDSGVSSRRVQCASARRSPREARDRRSTRFMPRFTATDAAGRTLPPLSYAAASGEAVPLIAKGSALPATNEVVVTTSGASQSVIKIVARARAAAAHCALLEILTVRVTPRPRGLAQVRHAPACLAKSARWRRTISSTERGRRDVDDGRGRRRNRRRFA